MSDIDNLENAELKEAFDAFDKVNEDQNKLEQIIKRMFNPRIGAGQYPRMNYWES